MHVVATAGHVDHGKSTLVRALTGMEPDRWAEEKRRGLTIDLGFAWTRLDSGREVSFVDVPGHESFLANMLAGLGPVPVVCFVVAADEGWRAQSSDHRDALAALDIRHGLLVLTKADRASSAQLADVRAQARAELSGTGLRDAPAVVVSAHTGAGLPELRSAVDKVLAGTPAAPTGGRVRLWLDRSFPVTGAGTVVTGTLAEGSITREDSLELRGTGSARPEPQPVVVRGLETCGDRVEVAEPTSRVGVNLRGLAADRTGRGDVLLTPDAWPDTSVLDVRRTSGQPFDDAPHQLTVHVGTAAVPARLRPFDADHARLTLEQPLPLVVTDRLVLRAPSSRRVRAGAVVLDADPPPLTRRGDGRRRAAALADFGDRPDPAAEVARRGAVPESHLRRLGLISAGTDVPSGVAVIGDWWVHRPTRARWAERLHTVVTDLDRADPLAPGLSRAAVRDRLGLPDDALVDAVVAEAGLEHQDGRVRLPGRRADLGPAEAAVATLEERLHAAPFRAPEAYDLQAWGLGERELAAAERAGRLLRLGEGIVLLPTAPALAVRELAGLPQPFTTSQARRALDSTRRVTIPLLEHLDRQGWTRRIDANHRQVNEKWSRTADGNRFLG